MNVKNILKEIMNKNSLITAIGMIFFLFSFLIETEFNPLIQKLGAILMILGSVIFLFNKKWR